MAEMGKCDRNGKGTMTYAEALGVAALGAYRISQGLWACSRLGDTEASSVG